MGTRAVAALLLLQAMPSSSRTPTLIVAAVGTLTVSCAAFLTFAAGQTPSNPAPRAISEVYAFAGAQEGKDASSVQNSASQVIATPPCVQNTNPGPDGAGPKPKTFKDYVTGNSVRAIVVGKVQSIEDVPGSTSGRSNYRLIVATFTVTGVLKSPGPLQQVEAGARNFGGTFAMKPGQRYVLFLGNENPTLVQLVPEHSGVPRFQISSSLCVDDTDRVHSSTKGSIGVESSALNPVMNPLDGITLDKAIAEIRAAVGSGGDKQ